MFLGHSAVALALVGLGAYALGWSREQALSLALFAGVVAALPDIDMLYALTGVLGLGSLDAFALADGFWRASTVVHRSVTHSVVLAVPIAASIGLVAAGGWKRIAGIVLAAIVIAGIAPESKPVFLLVSMAFVLGGVGLGVLADRWGIEPRIAALVAGVALFSHPFGDLFTGQPPWLLYPFETRVFLERVTLSPDPTLHLLGAFFIEIAAIWLGVYTVGRLRDSGIREHLRPRAVLGGGYAMAALVLPAPTLSVSYHFVFSVTAVGFLGAVPPRRRSSWQTRGITGLAAVTVAGVAYAVAYLLIGL